MATTPTSLHSDSAQFRGQPVTAILILAGDSRPWNRDSILIPSAVESPTPNRQNSDPTQVFTVRKLLP